MIAPCCCKRTLPSVTTSPVILMVVDINPQVLFYFLIDPFGLSIGLWVIGRREVPFNVQQLVQVLHEMGVKLGASVVDNLCRNAMQSEYLILVHFGHSFRGDRHVHGNCMYLFGVMIHHNANGSVRI